MPWIIHLSDLRVGLIRAAPRARPAPRVGEPVWGSIRSRRLEVGRSPTFEVGASAWLVPKTGPKRTECRKSPMLSWCGKADATEGRRDAMTRNFILLHILLGGGVLVLDLSVPLGAFGGVPYIVLALLCSRSPSRRYVVSCACAVSVLTVLGYHLSQAGGAPWLALIHRSSALFAIWAVALVSPGRQWELQETLNAVGAAVMVVDDEGKILWANRATAMLCPEVDAALVGRRCYEVLHDRDTPLPECAHCHTQLYQGSDSVEVYEAHRNQWLHISSHPIPDRPGAARHRVLVARDITERIRAESTLQKSESRQRAILAASVDPVICADRQGTIQFASESVKHVFGWDESELIGRNLKVLIPEAYRSEHDRHMKDFRKTGRSIVLGKTRLLEGLRRDGSVFPCEISINVVQVEGEIDPILVGVIRDVTERQRATEESHLLHAELAHASRLSVTGAMAAGLAHELNQPLGAIGAYADATVARADSRGDAEVVDAVSKIGAEARRAAQIVERVQRFARRSPRSRSPVDINDLIRETVGLLEAEAAKRGVSVTLDLFAGLSPVSADRVEIQQVLVNLARNGFDAMESTGRAKRELLIRSAPHRDEGIAVVVQDCGSGFSGDSSRLFEPFYTTKPEGTGLGLAISRMIVEDHGGRLWATNHPNGGATFHLTLPGQGASAYDSSRADRVRRG